MAKKKTAGTKSGSSLPTPEDREELFLAKAAGESVTLPTYDNDRKEIFLRAIAGKTDLPAVTDADNGKIMKVVNGAWSAEDMPTVTTSVKYIASANLLMNAQTVITSFITAALQSSNGYARTVNTFIETVDNISDATAIYNAVQEAVTVNCPLFCQMGPSDVYLTNFYSPTYGDIMFHYVMELTIPNVGSVSIISEIFCAISRSGDTGEIIGYSLRITGFANMIS